MESCNLSRGIALLFIPILILSISCSTARVITKDDIAKIEVGKTTKQELLSVLGLPNQRTVEGDKECYVYFKGASQTTANLAIIDSVKQPYKTGVPTYQFDTYSSVINPNVAALVWLDQSGVVCKLTKGDLK